MAEHNQRFDTFEQWCNKAPSWLTRHAAYDQISFRAICFDDHGRYCREGADFERAHDQGTFPVHWMWPDQAAVILRAALAEDS